MKLITMLLNKIRNVAPLVLRRNWLIANGVLLLMASQGVTAAGLLTPKDGSQPLVLAEQHVSVVVENGFAVTEIDQIFSNPHAIDKRAIYSFPVPDGAAVGEFTFWLDGLPVHAEVLEKEAARQLHESEQAAGGDSALVEQDEFRTFEMEVAPVRAGADVRVRLVYIQQAAVDHSMGRYVYPLQDGDVDETKNNFWARNEEVSEAFSFNLRLRSAYPVDAIRVTRGQATINQLDSGEWELNISSKSGAGAQLGKTLNDHEIAKTLELDAPPVLDSEQGSGNAASSSRQDTNSGGVYRLDHDIVVYWRLAQNLPGAIDLVTYKEPGASTGTFMLTVTPGIDLAPITEGRDWLFVLDTSGSMTSKFSTLIDGVQRALNALQPQDRFKVILFSSTARSLSETMLPATAESVAITLKQLDSLTAGGGTNLFDGLKSAVKSLDGERTSAIVLITDGVVNVGATQMTSFLKLMEKVDVRLFTAVMGNSANRPLLEGLTKHSEGFAMNVSNDDDVVGLMMQVVGKVTHEAMHNIDVVIDGVRTRDLTPAKFSRVYQGEQMIVMGKYKGSGSAQLTFNAEISGQKNQYFSDLQFPDADTSNPELERLWAFAGIKELQYQQDIVGETDDSKQGITDLALAHGLVTPYTSLIAVRDEVFAKAGIQRSNASRVERERLARTERLNQSIQQTRQDTQNPAFTANRAQTGSGGGSMGLWFLGLLVLLFFVRIGLEVKERREQD